MSDTDSLASVCEKPIFRPFTRDSLANIYIRIAQDEARKKELGRKRAEGEVHVHDILNLILFNICIFYTHRITIMLYHIVLHKLANFVFT